MQTHDDLYPSCQIQFNEIEKNRSEDKRLNEDQHQVIWSKHDELKKTFEEGRIQDLKDEGARREAKAIEMAELKTRVIILASLASAVASGLMLGIMGTGFWILQNYILKKP
jgi:hypothetical protein